MVTVGLDFGTHQTKICVEKTERGITTREVFKFKDASGRWRWTLPSFMRLLPDGRLNYGHHASEGCRVGTPYVYFKQDLFNILGSIKTDRLGISEEYSALYLAYVVFLLDRRYGGNQGSYILQTGMPTSSNPEKYSFAKAQAIKVVNSAFGIVREYFKGDKTRFLQTPYEDLRKIARQYIDFAKQNIANAAMSKNPIFVYPEAYAAILPLVQQKKLPNIGTILLVDIGGGTVDVSLFSGHTRYINGKQCPVLYVFDSFPWGLNRLAKAGSGNNVAVQEWDIDKGSEQKHRRNMHDCFDRICVMVKEAWLRRGLNNIWPLFSSFRDNIFNKRPIVYSGGGSIFSSLRKPIDGNGDDWFTDVRNAADMIGHQQFHLPDKALFNVLATAYSLSHLSLTNPPGTSSYSDEIFLAPMDDLLGGIHLPGM